MGIVCVSRETSAAGHAVVLAGKQGDGLLQQISHGRDGQRDDHRHRRNQHPGQNPHPRFQRTDLLFLGQLLAPGLLPGLHRIRPPGNANRHVGIHRIVLFTEEKPLVLLAEQVPESLH